MTVPKTKGHILIEQDKYDGDCEICGFWYGTKTTVYLNDEKIFEEDADTHLNGGDLYEDIYSMERIFTSLGYTFEYKVLKHD